MPLALTYEQTYRVWLVWGYNYWVTVFPILMVAGAIGAYYNNLECRDQSDWLRGLSSGGKWDDTSVHRLPLDFWCVHGRSWPLDHRNLRHDNLVCLL